MAQDLSSWGGAGIRLQRRAGVQGAAQAGATASCWSAQPRRAFAADPEDLPTATYVDMAAGDVRARIAQEQPGQRCATVGGQTAEPGEGAGKAATRWHGYNVD
ncbi:MAG: hypothetical protein U0703_26490 [Anaerolineae bacterium]